MKLHHALPACLVALLLGAPGASAAPSPTYHLRIRAVLTADDDGSHAATITGSQIQTLIANASTVWAGAGIGFDFDPATDIEHRHSTLLNNDCTLVDFDTNLSCDKQPNVEAREKLALDAQHESKITIFFRYGGADYSCEVFACSVTPASGAFSGRAGHYVAFPGSGGGGFALAHELGHYLWNSHTHGPQPKTVSEAQAAIVQYVEGAHPHPRSEGLDVFDGDLRNGDAADTPPDPGPDLWKAIKGDACASGFGSGFSSLTVTFSDQTQQTYPLGPNRSNIMSYFVSCSGFIHTSSPQQQDRARNAIELWNRGQLIGNPPSYAQLDVGWKGTAAVGSSVTPFTFKRRPHVLIYDSATGTATIERLRDDAAQGTGTIASGDLGAGWTTIMPFELNGKPHALLYSATSGQAQIIELTGPSGWTTLWQGGFKAGWTSMLPFELGGAPHALLYNAATGAAKIIELLGASGWSFVWEGGFKTGWTSLVPIELDGAPHALLYNSDTGAAKIIRLLGGSGWSFVWESGWSTGWTTFMPFDRGARQRLLAYKSGNGQLNAIQVNPGGAGVSLLSTTTWPTGYSSLVPARLLGLWYGYAYNNANPAATRIVAITQ